MWSDQEKRNYVWEHLVESASSGGSNTDVYVPLTVTDGDHEFASTLLSRSEQRIILQDFQREGKIKLYNFEQSDPKSGYLFEILEPDRKRKSVYSRHITSLGELIKNIELRNRVMTLIIEAFGVYDAREIRANQAVGSDTHEKNEELLLLMDELGLTETNWDSLQHQTHRTIGNRYVHVLFRGDVAKKLADSISGRSSIIRVKALDQMSYVIKELATQDKLNDIFVQLGVPTSLLLDNQNTKHDLVYNVILALSSTGEEEDKKLLFEILEEFAHPLTFGGEVKRSEKFQVDITKLIRYDGLSLLGGHVHSFTDQDEKRLTEYEKKQNEVSPETINVIQDFFHGNPFGGSLFGTKPRSEAPKPAVEKSPVTQVKEPATTHIHIYNDNKNTQQIEVPLHPFQSTPTPQPRHDSVKVNEGLFPAAKWEQVEIKFNNGNDVTISCQGKQVSSNYIAMGFEDTKKHMPNTQWKILQYMADHERFISFDQARPFTSDLKSQKKELLQKLQEFFGIFEDAFEYIESEVGSGYLAKFDLRPEKEIPSSYLRSIE